MYIYKYSIVSILKIYMIDINIYIFTLNRPLQQESSFPTIIFWAVKTGSEYIFFENKIQPSSQSVDVVKSAMNWFVFC